MHTHQCLNTNMLPEGCLRDWVLLCKSTQQAENHYSVLTNEKQGYSSNDLSEDSNQTCRSCLVNSKLLDIITCYCNIANITHCRIRRFIQQSELRTGFSGMERRDQMTYLTLSARVALYLYQGPSCDVWKTKGSAKMTCNRGE